MESRRSLWSSLFLLAVIHNCTAGTSTTSESLSCLSCVFYANMAMPINNRQCASGVGVNVQPCADAHACKVTFLQDSSGATVHAARNCLRSPGGRTQLPDVAALVFNARTTMYCDSSGCNNNWLGRAVPGGGAAGRKRQRLHCWVGHGRRIDEFELQPCSDKVMKLTDAHGSRSGGVRLAETPVCLLAQLSRQIKYNGRAFESVMYLADCVPHASSVYGRNYPMFEYERVCREAGCNSGPAAGKLQDGLIVAGFAAGGASRSIASQCGSAASLLATIATVAWATADIVLL